MSLAMEKMNNPVTVDHALVASILLLTGAGLATLYSSSFAFGEHFFGDGYYFIARQLLLCVLGLAGFLLAAYVPLDFFRKLIPFLLVLAVFFCILTFVPGVGVSKNGASRWIRVGATTYQPSELVKLTLPLYLAHIFDKKKERLQESGLAALPQALITALFFILIYLQNNFSTAIFVTINALVIFFLAGVKLRFFVSTAVILFPLSAYLVLTKEHRLRRLISFIRPDWEPLGAGYQVRSSVLTIGSGGLLGRGIGQGVRKLGSVPEIQSDFIFSSYAEEFGFAGILLFYGLFIFFALRGYQSALRAREGGDGFRYLLVTGFVTLICSQALLNIAVVSGALPATGIPLPFFSAGGSSLATTLTITGFIVNVSRGGGEKHVY